MWARTKPFTVIAATGLGAVFSNEFLKDQTIPFKDEISLEEKKRKASEVISRHMVTRGIPGISISISKDGKPVWSEGFGYADVETGAKCKGDTVMRIASISKPFTAAIAMGLVQDGLLDLDKSIHDYLPNFPKKTHEGKRVTITTRQLLSHTAGIRHYEKKDAKSELKDMKNEDKEKEFLYNVEYKTVTDALEMFKDDELLAEPGIKFSYTTHGFTLASAILEKVSEKQFTKLVSELCRSLGLLHTHLDVNETIINNRASYYVRKDGVLRNCQEVNNSYKWAAGGLLSTTTDLLRFANALLYSYQSGAKDALLTKDTISEMWRGEIEMSTKNQSCLGWMRMASDKVGGITSSQDVWYHEGGAVGASSVLLIHPTAGQSPSGICIAMLCNLQGTSLLKLAKEIEQIFKE